MSNIQQSLDRALHKAAGQLRGLGIPESETLAERFEAMSARIYQPCLVAIVGQVKVGKSSFINALLGVDLAKVDIQETTATINQFCYGKIAPELPVRVKWRTKEGEEPRYTYEKFDFLDSLQGNEQATLDKAKDIEHLEYYLRSPYLERVTIVDTPGMGSTVAEHQKRSAEFMRLQPLLQALSDLHEQDTQHFADTADAIIYLIKQVALSSDQKYLEEFKQRLQGKARAFNAIGILSQVDRYPDVAQGRAALDKHAEKVAEQFKEYLNIVVPISAALRRALDGLLANNAAGLERIMKAFRTSPPLSHDDLKQLLSNVQLYLTLPDTEISIPMEVREELLGEMDFDLFSTIVRVAVNLTLTDVHAVRGQLESIAGFERLKEVLDRQIFRRSTLLRCYTIVDDALTLLNDIQTTILLKLSERDHQNTLRQAQLLSYIQETASDSALVRGLEACVRTQLAPKADQLKAIVRTLERDFGRILHELEQHHTDFDALHQVLDNPQLFPLATEVEELKALLGFGGLETKDRLSAGETTVKYVKERMETWKRASILASKRIRRDIAQQVLSRYNMILEEIKMNGL